MVRASVEPNHTMRLGMELEIRPNDPRLIIEVKSDIPITTYLVDDMGLEDFREGKTPDYYAGFSDRRNHQADLTLPSFKRYHLLMLNKSEDRTAKVDYEVRRLQ